MIINTFRLKVRGRLVQLVKTNKKRGRDRVNNENLHVKVKGIKVAVNYCTHILSLVINGVFYIIYRLNHN